MARISNIGAEAQKVNSVKAEKDRIEKEKMLLVLVCCGDVCSGQQNTEIQNKCMCTHFCNFG